MEKPPIIEILLKAQDLGAETVQRLGTGIAVAGKAMVLAYSFAVAAATLAISKFKSSEESTNALATALVKNGVYSKELTSSYQDYANQIAETSLFSKGSVVQAEAVLQRYLGQQKITPELLKATADFAASKTMDLESAAVVVGKSIGTATNALGRYGIMIDEHATKAQRTDQAVRGLNKQFEGQAKASTLGLGSLKKMAHAIEKLFTILGKSLAPVIVAAAKEMTKLAQEVQSNTESIRALDATIEYFSASTVFIKGILNGAGILIVNSVGTWVDMFKDIKDRKVDETIGRFIQGQKDAYNLLMAQKKETMKEYYSLNNKLKSRKEYAARKELDLIKRSHENELQRTTELFLTQEQTFTYRSEEEIIKAKSQESIKTDEHLKTLNLKISRTEDITEKYKLENAKRKYLLDKYYTARLDQAEKTQKVEIFLQQKPIEDFETDILQIYANMQNSGVSALMTLGKVAAVLNLELNSVRGAAASFSWCSQYIPYIGDIIGGVIAGLILTYGKEQQGMILGLDIYDLYSEENNGIWERIKNLIAAPWDDPTAAAQIIVRFGAAALNSLKDNWTVEIPGTNGDTRPFGDTNPGQGQEGDTGGMAFNLEKWFNAIGEDIGNTTVDSWDDVVFPFHPWLEEGTNAPIKVNKVNVTVLGGLNGSEEDVKRIALEIHKATG